MLPDLQDTIVALSSAPGPGARAIIRLSGARALAIATRLFQASGTITSDQRRLHQGHLQLPGFASPLPADLYLWPAPRSYTGQEVVELHTISSPPLVDLIVSEFLGSGARAAQPGEFTMRAFLAGKLDLTRVEAVLGVIEAGNRDELKQALVQLAGGVTWPLQDLREDLLNLLADVEAGLDFTDEDIRFVDRDELLQRLSRGMALVTLLRKQLDQRGLGDRPFRVVLAGRPNAGKSSLFNALARTPAALVSSDPGTTRDYLSQRVLLDGVPIDLIDTAGWRDAVDTVDEQAQQLGREQAQQTDLVLLCLETGLPPTQEEQTLLTRVEKPLVLGIATKCDLAPSQLPLLATSAVTRLGLAELGQLLAERARARLCPALAPSWSRCRHHVESCLNHLRQAHAIVLDEEPPELLAVELRSALEQLGEMVGAVYTDDLLDRIFGRFCIGK